MKLKRKETEREIIKGLESKPARRKESKEWKGKDKYNSSLGRYVFGSEISYNKAPPPLPGLAY